jgi:hypothetical protein
MIGKLWGWLFGEPTTPRSKIVEAPVMSPESHVYVPPPAPEPAPVHTPVVEVAAEAPSTPAEEIKTAVAKNAKPKRNNSRKNAAKKSK